MLKLIVVKFLYLIQVISGYSSSSTHRDWDICSHWNGRRHFLELGERGELHAHNVSASNYRSTLYAPPPLNISSSNKTLSSSSSTSSIYNADIWYQCNLELVTCAECVIRITFTYTNFSRQCETPINLLNTKINDDNSGNHESTSNTSPAKSRCPCEHILFSEPPYDPNGQDFCGDGKVFRSKTRALMLKFYFRATYTHVFTLQYFSERNVKIISGSPKQSIINSNYSQSTSQIISTPYFPMPYPRDYGVEHILTCESENCHVRLEFTDFHLGLASTMEVFDSNGQMIDSYTGEYFRPPIIISTGKSLLLQFRGNGVNGLGYKAEVKFVSSKQVLDKSMTPFTDCGGMVETLGGAITMMKMLDNETETKLYDCIWIIKPGNSYMMMKTHISVRVDAFVKMLSKSELVIREGITSDSEILEILTMPNNGISDKTHIVPIITGFYIRLHGTFGINSRLAIVFSVFNFMSCYIGSEFLCQNNHCISVRLHCDGFDHCGDGSDEPESCLQEWSHIQRERSWYSHKPNYYFPKVDQYPDLKTATGIFVMSTLGILIVLSGWMMILYRMGVRARHQRELQNHLQTISELLDRQEEITVEDHPPDYEAPPDYEEVIKIDMENGRNSCSSASTTPHSNRTRRSPRQRGGRSRNRNNNDTNNNQFNHQNQHLVEAGTSTEINNNNNASSNDNNDVTNQNENLANIASRVLNGSGICETSDTIASSAAETQSQTIQSNAASQIRTVSSESSVSNGCFVSDTNQPLQQQQQNSNYSIVNSTQYEECSTGFGDESLNISFSLAIPKPTINEKKNIKLNKNFMYSENNHLKKAWVVFNTGQVHTICKRPRLRQTFSSPETFLNEFFESDDMNYGSTNIRSDNRNSFLSNGTIFGSDLSSDALDTSVHEDNATVNNENSQSKILCSDNEMNLSDKNKCQIIEIQPEDGNNDDTDIGDNDNLQLIGTVSLFGEVVKKHQQIRKSVNNNNNNSKKRLSGRRSKSLNNHIDRHIVNGKLKRSSSADLLIHQQSVISTSMNNFYI